MGEAARAEGSNGSGIVVRPWTLSADDRSLSANDPLRVARLG